MRVLVSAIYDTPRSTHWRGDSCFLWAKCMVDAAVERGYYVYWVLPEGYDVPPRPNVKVLRFRFGDRLPPSNLHQHYLVMGAITQEFVGAHGDRFVDAIVCNDAFLALLQRDWFGARRFFEHTPVLHWHGYPTILDWSETNWVRNNDESPLFMRALGYAQADFVSCCPYCSGRTFELVKAFCPPQMVRRFLETRAEVMMCADCDLLDSIDVPKAEKFSMYWGGRFTTTKGGEKSVQQYLQFLMGGRDVEIYVTAVGGARRLHDVLKRYGAKDAVHAFQDLSYEQAQQVMKRCHVGIFHQLNPGAAAPYEWLYGGLVVLFKKHHYPEELEMYPPGYPFLFDSDEEGAAMLRWVYENYDEAQRQLQETKTREWVKEKTDKRRGAHRIWQLAEERRVPGVQAGMHYKLYEETVELVEKALSAFEGPVPFPQLLQAISKAAGREIVQTRWSQELKGLLPFSIYKSFVPEGWVDSCEHEVPTYVRRQ